MRNARSIGRVTSSYSKTSVPCRGLTKKTRIDYPASYSKLDYMQKPYSLRWNCSYFQASKTWSFTWLYFESDRFLETENHDHVILFHRAFLSQRKFLNGYQPFKLKSPKIPLQDNTMLICNYNHILLSPFILKCKCWREIQTAHSRDHYKRPLSGWFSLMICLVWTLPSPPESIQSTRTLC